MKTKFIKALVSTAILLSASAFAVEYVDTEIINTETQQSGSNDSLKGKYDKKPISDEELGRLVDQETVKLNAVMRSTIMTVVTNAKGGQPNMTVLARDDARSVPLAEVLPVDADWEAEKRKREMEERIQIERFKNGDITREELEQQILRSVFPVRTTLQPTKLPSRTLAIDTRLASKIYEPIAVIGADQYSLAWFKANKDLLTNLRAGIIVTQVENPVDLEAIRTIAPNLHYQPLDATEFLQTVGVSVYPILITSQGALQ